MKAYKVGGAVRDRLLGRPVTDTDWVVVGSTPEAMQAEGFRPVGQDFPVFLHPDSNEEFALARTERKTGHGYKGFAFNTSPEVTLEEDLQRRDVTVNAMAENESGEIIDPTGGRQDLDRRVLRHISPAFAEDPLRVLRVARFAAQLDFSIAPETLALMRELSTAEELGTLPAERLWREWHKSLASQRPDKFLVALRACGAMALLLPAMDASFDTPLAGQALPAATVGQSLLAALALATAGGAGLPVRYAATLSLLPEVSTVNKQFGVPREFADLAESVTRLRPSIHGADALTPAAIVSLLQDADAFRRPGRFLDIVAVCGFEARARGLHAAYLPGALLPLALRAANAVDAGRIAAQGLKGPAIGEAVRQARIAAVRDAFTAWFP